MAMKTNGMVKVLIAGVAIGFLAACHHEAPPQVIDFRQQLPEGMLALRKIDPAEYPDFGRQPINIERLKAAIGNSQKYLAQPSSKDFFPYLDITHDRAVASLAKLGQICDAQTARGSWDPVWFNSQIRDNFDVYKSYGAPRPDGAGFTDRVQFTGYFTPIYDASLTHDGPYQWPLYKLPADLSRDPNTGQVFGRKTDSGQVVPYYTRQEIETGGKLAGTELVWLKSRWEAYIITIQGSARLRLTDGRTYEVGFAGTNGYPYTSPGKQMVADGVITTEQLSLKGLGNYFAAHPEMMDKYLAINQRFVFFTERPGGPFGSLNVPVTPLGSIATDKETKDIYPRAMPAFLSVPIPDASGTVMTPFSGFLMDQDTGGAIRASGRCDIYMGIGPEAEIVAGHELQEGALYYIAIKPELMSPTAGTADSSPLK